ncbi:MAG: 7-carboxy-7-deazaguanine synthase QueE [Phycisphaerae bacterium]
MAATDRLRINEIFHSLQGEGTRTGERCVFVRLTGCHLRCTYCDTEYSFHEGEWMSLDQVVERVRSFGCAFVEVTGGEPLLQPAVLPLLSRLCDGFATVALETSGALSIEQVDPRVVRIVDFKTPASGEVERNHWPNVALLTPRDEVKFVIADRADYDWAVGVLRRHELHRRCTVLFSPVVGHAGGVFQLYQGHLSPRVLAEWILADALPVRFMLQLHKVIWSPTARGV